MIKIHRLIYLKIGRGRKLKLPEVKNLKKDVDISFSTWYHKRVACETNSNKEPWQINSNATLKILWENSESEENT